MCGVIGLIQNSGADAPQKALSALKVMEYRGYDSWGVAWGVRRAGTTHATAYKQVGQIGAASLPPNAVSTQALGHTRWATHGGVTVANAHPHVSSDQRFALVHNGVLENYQSLKSMHVQSGYDFKSETDTEVIVATWERAFEQISKHSDATIQQQLQQTARECFSKLEGSNAIVVMDFVSGYGVAVRTGSPLIIGKSSEGYCVVSDVLALVGVAQLYTVVDEGEIVIFTATHAEFYELSSLQPRVKQWQPLHLSATEVSKGTHAHFMQKEIAESGEVIERLLASSDFHARLTEAAADLADTVYFVGCGTAYHAALYGATILTALTNKTAFAFSANEFETWVDKAVSGSVIFISQSGETADVLVHARKLAERNIPFTAIVNRDQSSLAELARHSIPSMAGPEQAVVASKSFVAQLGVLLLLVAQLTDKSSLKKAIKSSMHKVMAEVAALVSQLSTSTQWHSLINQIAQSESVYILGRGKLHPLALEAALKLKEAAYVHAEGFSAGELKHGVLALVQAGTPVISLATDPETRALDYASIQEVKAREGAVSIISDQAVPNLGLTLRVKQIGIAMPLLVAVAGQLLAYAVACAKGIDPDKPRNLAKSVTVR